MGLEHLDTTNSSLGNKILEGFIGFDQPHTLYCPEPYSIPDFEKVCLNSFCQENYIIKNASSFKVSTHVTNPELAEKINRVALKILGIH